nr:DUF1972 domain-containing protein [Patulibacter sp. SYSU D01012]
MRHVAIIGSRGFPSTYGGYETAVRYIARDWVARGIAVTVYCRSREGAARTWVAEGVTCRYTPGVETNSLSTLTFGATECLHAATRLKPDAALVLNIANGFWLPALRAAGIPTALNTDGIEWERGKWSRLGKQVFYRGAQASAKYADVLICDSEAIGDIWRREFGVESVFVPYGAPVLDDVGDDRVRALGLRPGTYALAVARLIPENNVDLFVDAIEASNGSIPAVVVGSATYSTPLENRLRHLDHQGRLRWLGHVSDQELLTQLWANAGVYVHGHSVGGTNPALLQALGAGAPTIAFDSPFNREVLGQDAQDAVFGTSPTDLLATLAAVLPDPARRRAMRARGQRTVLERYNWRNVAEGYLSALAGARTLRARARQVSGGASQ